MIYAKYDPEGVREEIAQRKRGKKEGGELKVWQILLAALLVGLWVGAWKWIGGDGGASTSATAPRKTDQCSEAYASVMAKEYVKQRLKAPSTAKFPWGMDGVTRTSAGPCTFRVVSYVDSQNSFGGMLRSNYAMNLSYDAATENWQVSDFVFLSR